MFCSPEGVCAELEPFAGKGQHPRCDTPDDCAEDELCVVSEFRRHAPRVFWSGPLGVCARFRTKHWRTRVTMNIRGDDDTLSLIRNDSRAMVAANSVLGDQLVGISPGRGDPLDDDHQIQSRASLYEDIDRLRARIDSATSNADDSFLAIVTLIEELRDEQFLDTVKSTLGNVEIITRKMSRGDGLVGAMLNSPAYKADVGESIAALERTGRGLETAAGRANRILGQVDRDALGLLDDGQATLASIAQLLEDLEDPSNGSLGAKLLRDSDGRLTEGIGEVIANTAEITQSVRSITQSIDRGDGTLGKLINDPSLREDIGRLLANIASRDWLKTLTAWYLERKGIADIASTRSSARPPRPTSRGSAARPR
jgi:phospholipid/cholesterol/gamma-HCH transport system substrate-binding protein